MMAERTTKIDENAEFEIVKDYIIRCPHVSSAQSPAIMAALEGIEREQKRRVRDAKLQFKFGGKRSATAVTSDSETNDEADGEFTFRDMSDRNELVVVEKDDVVVTNDRIDTEEEDKEWQNVSPKDEDDASSESNIDHSFVMEGQSDGSSFLGSSLAKACVDAIAEQNYKNPVLVSSPIGAIAVALHAALRSLGFACTGIPEEESSKKGGFAAPIRELNKNQFLPYRWDDSSSSVGKNIVSLRYRKMDMGAVVLTVESIDDEGYNVKVTLVLANSKDSTPSHELIFPLSDHINLDSWNAAMLKKVGTKIAPSLHHKNLSGLMRKFCRIFDLGAVNDTIDGESFVTAAVGIAFIKKDSITKPTSATLYPQAVTRVEHYPNRRSEGTSAPQPVSWEEGYVPSTFDQAFPQRNPIHGDFDSDILPATGLQDPRSHSGRYSGVGIGGNLMGPNHPMFSPGVGGHGQIMGGRGVGYGGPGTLQPRFDPVYPPGVDGDLRHDPPVGRRPHKKPSRTGEPNPDHLLPPNSLSCNGNNNHMFM
mmetsp:Transcript_45454/g.46018  ORF Transcript_45454/g.46018 Transcript_45454/m.46018 type:complete len:535 (-) Transcript_45454:445-2049(-)